MTVLSEIAAALGGAFEGEDLAVARPAHPALAGPDDLALAFDPAYAPALKGCRARAALLWAGADWRALGFEGAVFTDSARAALSAVTGAFAPERRGPPGVHPSAVVEAGAQVDESASVGPFTVISAGARIGARATIRAQAYIGAGAVIGPDVEIASGARILSGVEIGARSIIHPNAVIGADGFSFVARGADPVDIAKRGGKIEDGPLELMRIHSLGGVVVGADVEIGAGATIDAGTVAPTRIGDGTKIDNLAQIAHNVSVGEGCRICAQVGVAGSAKIGDRVVLGGQCGVADQVRVASGTVAGARSAIARDVREASFLLGQPAVAGADGLRQAVATTKLPALFETVRALKKRLSALEARR